MKNELDTACIVCAFSANLLDSFGWGTAPRPYTIAILVRVKWHQKKLVWIIFFFKYNTFSWKLQDIHGMIKYQYSVLAITEMQVQYFQLRMLCIPSLSIMYGNSWSNGF